MKPVILIAAILLLVFIAKTEYSSQKERQQQVQISYRSPIIFENQIVQYESIDAKHQSQPGAIVVAGSSSITLWTKRIDKDLAPLTLITRGFGSSNMNDLLHYSERLIIKHKPRAVMIYEGENDISQGLTVKQITDKFFQLKDKLMKNNKDLRIYIISTKPSPRRMHLLDKIQQLNIELRNICQQNPNLYFIDTFSTMMTEGELKQDIFLTDNLHLNNNGYNLWTKAVRDVLITNEAKYEQ